MIQRKSKWKTCKACGDRKCIEDETVTCDDCRIVLGLEYLHADDFANGVRGNIKRLHFCCWLCCLRVLRRRNVRDFTTLPYLSNEKGKGKSAVDFWRAIETLGKE